MALKAVALIKQQQGLDNTPLKNASSPRSIVWYENPLLLSLLAIVGLVIAIVLLLLVSIMVSRRRRVIAKFKQEQEGAEQRAELEAQRIRMDEVAFRAEQAQQQHILPAI